MAQPVSGIASGALSGQFSNIGLDSKLNGLPQCSQMSLKKEAEIESDPTVSSGSVDAVHVPLESVRDLVAKFDKCWNEEKKDFENVPVDLVRFRTRISTYIQQFRSSFDLKNAYGFIEKRDFVRPTIIGVHADFHADLKSALELLKQFQKDGLLDENYKCKQDVQIVFLGDYTDRGDYSTQVLELLLALHMENPGQVVLLRGNHEYLSTHQLFVPEIGMGGYIGENDSAFRQFVFDEQNKKLFEELYATMPLSLYVGQKDETGNRQYVQFSHGLVELCVDPSGTLDSPDERTQMIVPKAHKLSGRIQAIDVCDSVDYVNLLAHETDKGKRKLLKLQQSAQRIKQLVRDETVRRKVTTYAWGDMTDPEKEDIDLASFGVKRVSCVGDPCERKWNLTEEDVKHYLRLSGNKHCVKMIIRAHQHIYDVFKFQGKIVVITLPIGMDNKYYQAISKQPSRAYLLTTAPKVKDWQKVVLVREQGSSQTTRMGPYSMRDSTV